MERKIPTEDEVLGWYTSLSNWGRWGPDDQRGTLNLITDAKRVESSQLVRTGVTVSLGRTITYEPTLDAPVPNRHFMTRSGDGASPDGIGRTNAMDNFLLVPHGRTVTHIDAPSHTFIRVAPDRPWTMYNGIPREQVTTEAGATAGSAELAGDGIVGRAVLLDIPKVRKVEWLEPSQAVFPEDLEAAEAAEGVRVVTGDILLVRTGWPARRGHVGPRPPTEMVSLQAACLPWLKQRDVAVLGSDTSNDIDPTEYPNLGVHGAIHGVGMGAMGLWLLDNADFEELARTCDRLGRWEFQVVISLLKLEGATGCPVNPIALF